MKLFRTALASALTLGMMATATHAQEHPEHPSKTAAKKETVTVAMLSQAIKDYVAADSKLKGGSYLVYDPVDKKVLQLTLSKVHDDKLSTLGGGVYFACADFVTPDGKTYDLDIFMKGDDKRLETTEVTVHKVAGQPRYSWSETDGIWCKVDATTKKP